MKKLVLCLSSIAFLSVISISTSLADETRNYTKFVKDKNGKPFLKIECNYIGKKPIGQFDYNVNWKTYNIDFYNMNFVNLTSHPITLVSSKNYSKVLHSETEYLKKEDGTIEVKRVPAVRHRDYSKEPSPRGNVIEPYEVREIKNLWYVPDSGVPIDIRYYDTTVEYDGNKYTFQWHIVYEK